jgi:2-keto-3-deoxy-L-rhamnonate aldolase RhmA
MRPNRLRQLLNEGKPTLGTHIICPWPGMVEIMCAQGSFDYIEFVGEYSSWSLPQLDEFGRAIDLFPHMSAMMKVEEPSRPFIATRSLDAGIQNMLFTDIRTADDARECVRMVRAETPEDRGTHGAGMRRAIGYVYGDQKEWVKAMRETVIALMIEKKGAIENLEEILAVPGIDMVQFGPTDYSISVGLAGEGRGEKVQGSHKKMIETALKMGVHPRVEIGSFEQAKPFIDMGVKHFCIGWDISIVAEWCRKQKAGLAELFPGR